jgi:ergothioneine biosynthesis protein EgtB
MNAEVVSTKHITTDRTQLFERYHRVRQQTETLVQPLTIEDCVVQTSLECSPVKWHLAHTTWFFETFVLLASDPTYTEFNSKYGYLFNSYYNTIGDRTPRPARGLMSRPTLEEVRAYREHVDHAMDRFVKNTGEALLEKVKDIILLGTHHEQQHQELILTDVKTVLAMNPLRPIYHTSGSTGSNKIGELSFVSFEGGLVEIGTNGPGFFFDNEGPRHQQYLEPFELGNRLITNGEYKQFIADGGYRNSLLWLSDGFAKVAEEQWEAPKYWESHDGEWWHMTLRSFEPVSDSEPVTHVSHYEADAFARWSGARLPTEFEWEHAASSVAIDGNFLEAQKFHPISSMTNRQSLQQMFGDGWEWTQSAYLPYPRYKTAEGAIGEYNGKFMSNQMVLRGGSYATPQDHIRATYRNFFPPDARWQFSGIRLARNTE